MAEWVLSLTDEERDVLLLVIEGHITAMTRATNSIAMKGRLDLVVAARHRIQVLTDIGSNIAALTPPVSESDVASGMCGVVAMIHNGTIEVKCVLPAGHLGQHFAGMVDRCESVAMTLDGQQVRCDLVAGHFGEHMSDARNAVPGG